MKKNILQPATGIAFAIIALVFVGQEAMAWTQEKKAKLAACRADCDAIYQKWTMEHARCEGKCWDEYWNTDGSLTPESSPEPLPGIGSTGGEGWIGDRIQTAVTDCDIECRGASEDYYDTCKSECEARQTGSVERPTMVAEGSVQGASTPKETQFAALLPGDPSPNCGSDAFACFGGIDESPDTRVIDPAPFFEVFASR